jgi:hypothetical protein
LNASGVGGGQVSECRQYFSFLTSGGQCQRVNGAYLLRHSVVDQGVQAAIAQGGKHLLLLGDVWPDMSTLEGVGKRLRSFVIHEVNSISLHPGDPGAAE